MDADATDTPGWDDEQATLPGDEWPVADEYGSPDDMLRDERGTVVVRSAERTGPQSSRSVALLVPLLVVAGALGAGGAWLATSVAESRVGGAGSPTPASPVDASVTDVTVATATSGAVTTTAAKAPPPPAQEETAPTRTAVASVTLPRLVGLRAPEAIRRLRALGLHASTRPVVSGRRPDTVVDQRPEAAASVDPGSVVALDVARRASTVAAPRLVGATVGEAQARLRQLGLAWSVARMPSQEADGTVVGQSPSAGSRLRKGATVTLRVSSGPAAVAVPDVTGLGEADARARLGAAGFEVVAVDEPTDDPAQDGVVGSQDPAGGAEAPERSTVTITVSRLS
jgi:beta-lactam-binding protein with PASTA domain